MNIIVNSKLYSNISIEMEGAFFIQEMINNVIEADELNNQPVRRVRTPRDPFSLSDTQFIKFFRLNKQTARYLINLLNPFLEQANRLSAITSETKVNDCILI